MSTLLWILVSTFSISIIAFIGILTLLIKEKLLKKILSFLVAFSAGVLMGNAFLHLMPMALENFTDYNIFFYVLIGFIIFFLVEKVFYWHHCHEGKSPVRAFAYTSLFGDGVHNFIDGLIIAASFVINIRLGILTTFAIALHEIPQEIGDFAVLIYGGFEKRKALFFNFITALTAVLGGIVGFLLSNYAETFIIFLLPFAAGGFIYIAASDLIPEIKKEPDARKSLLNFAVFVFGILVMYAL